MLEVDCASAWYLTPIMIEPPHDDKLMMLRCFLAGSTGSCELFYDWWWHWHKTFPVDLCALLLWGKNKFNCNGLTNKYDFMVRTQSSADSASLCTLGRSTETILDKVWRHMLDRRLTSPHLSCSRWLLLLHFTVCCGAALPVMDQLLLSCGTEASSAFHIVEAGRVSVEDCFRSAGRPEISCIMLLPHVVNDSHWSPGSTRATSKTSGTLTEMCSRFPTSPAARKHFSHQCVDKLLLPPQTFSGSKPWQHKPSIRNISGYTIWWVTSSRLFLRPNEPFVIMF